jgi:hypothetical protein
MVTPTQPIVFSDDNSREKYHIKMIIGAHVCGARSQLLFGLKNWFAGYIYGGSL